jgi:hypothetical protein
MSPAMSPIAVRDREQGQGETALPPKKNPTNNWKTMEIRANARKNEENLGKYITKYIKFWSFHFNV